MRRLIMVLIGILMISGCSSKFAYNNFDWLVYWYVDDYIELTDEQEDMFDERVANWLKWHRGDELSVYAEHLKRIKSMALGEQLSANDIVAEFEVGRAHWERLRDEVSPGLAQMATSLSDEQVVYFFAQLEKENREELEERQEDLAEKSEQERLEDRIESITENLEEFVGKTTKQQRDIVASYAPQFESTYDYWLAYRNDVQQRARALFVSRNNNPEFVDQLTSLMTNPDQYRTEEHIRIGNENRFLYATMLSELQASLTDKQKRRITKEVEGIIDDLEDLMDA